MVRVERSDEGSNTDGRLGLRKCLQSPELPERARAAVTAQAGIKLIFVTFSRQICTPRRHGAQRHGQPPCAICPAPWASWVSEGAL